MLLVGLACPCSCRPARKARSQMSDPHARGVVPCHISVGRFDGLGELRWTARRLRLVVLGDARSTAGPGPARARVTGSMPGVALSAEIHDAPRWMVLSLRGKVTRADLKLVDCTLQLTLELRSALGPEPLDGRRIIARGTLADGDKFEALVTALDAVRRRRFAMLSPHAELLLNSLTVLCWWRSDGREACDAVVG
jgi:hypothetical protein